MSQRQVQLISSLIEQHRLPWNVPWEGGAVLASGSPSPIAFPSGMHITLLSPRPMELARLAKTWAKESKRKGVEPEEKAVREERVAQGKRYRAILVHATADVEWANMFTNHRHHPEVRKEWLSLPLDGEPRKSLQGNAALRRQLHEADCVVLLVSRHLLESRGLKIVMSSVLTADDPVPMTWVLTESCAWQETQLNNFQAAFNVQTPLNALTRSECDAAVGAIIERVQRSLIDPSTDGALESVTTIDKGMNIEELADKRFTGDASVPNAASIAFLAEYNDRSLLVGGDANDTVLCESIRKLLRLRKQERLRVGAYVVSHSGSARNTGKELLQLLDCDRYLFSTNGARFNRPERETIARILVHGRANPDRPLTLVFNYRTATTDIWGNPALKRRYRYEAVYPTSENEGVKIEV